MSDSSSSSSSSSSSEEPKKRAKAAEIAREITDAVDLAALCAKSGDDDEFKPGVTEREWTPENQTALKDGVELANELIRQIKAARAGKKALTREEEDARSELILALDPILTEAKRTFTEGQMHGWEAAAKSYGRGGEETVNLMDGHGWGTEGAR